MKILFFGKFLCDPAVWNEYLLIKGLLNKFDYTVSAGYESAELACDIREKRLKKEVESFLEGKDLRSAQQFMKEHTDDNLVVIAPTGSGKTEAALLWLDGEKGFYTLPLKVSSNAIYSRIKSGYGYEHAAILHSDSMAMYLKENPGSAWEKQEQAKLLANPVTVCTIDQLFTFVYRALGTEIFAATLKYSKLIIDEIQSYDPRSIATILYGLKTIQQMGGRYAIITATFPPVLKDFMEQYGLADQCLFADFTDNPDITIQRAMDMVIADLKEPRFSSVTEQYYRDEYLQGEVYAGSEAEIVDFVELSEKAEEVEQADLEAKQAEFRENNPDVVADFRAKTEELFHSLDGQSADDIEKTVYAYVQSQIDEYGLDAQIVDVVVSGSRCRGIEQENSDLDVVVEYTGSTREDDLFNMLHEDSIYIAGIQVDINPITESRTGTLETYLPEVETYLQEKAQQEQINNQLVTQGRELVQEQNALVSEEKVLSELEKEPVIEPETVHITFTVAECGEFHNMGEYHEGIETIEEAMKLYNAIDPSRMHGIPSIGVNMHIEGTEEWEDEQADIVSGKRIDVDFLNYTPELRDTPKVQDAIKKLIAAYPEKDVIDMETKEQKIQTLAAELDQLSYEIDTYGYRDSVSDRESQIQMIADDIRTGNVKPLSIFLQASIDEGIDEDSERQAKELLVKLAEYKPLAKIEELEEQNYNMIDDRLNNGVEKFNREEEKKEQREKPQARSSLKERLAAKQKEATQGNNKDTKELEKSKNSHREM